MKLKIIGSILFVFLYVSCTKNKSKINLNEKNFSLINLRQEFPIIHISDIFLDNSSLGLTCENCILPNDKKLYIHSIHINKENKSISTKPLGWGVSFEFIFDNNRIIKQTITSCSDWDISYSYFNTDEFLYQISKIENENEIDTTKYKLDSLGRVIEVNGIEYGDLIKSNVSKKLYYSGKCSIPDSINSIFKAKYSNNGIRKEVFYYNNQKIDSIFIEETFSNSNFTERNTFTNYFDKNERFISQKRNGNNVFHVEKNKN